MAQPEINHINTNTTADDDNDIPIGDTRSENGASEDFQSSDTININHDRQQQRTLASVLMTKSLPQMIMPNEPLASTSSLIEVNNNNRSCNANKNHNRINIGGTSNFSSKASRSHSLINNNGNNIHPNNKMKSTSESKSASYYKFPNGIIIPLNHKNVYEWTVEDVSRWLQLNQFENYVHLFCDQHRIDGRVLVHLTAEDLRSDPLKLTIFGDIKRFCLAFQHLLSFYSNEDWLAKLEEQTKTINNKNGECNKTFPKTNPYRSGNKQQHSVIQNHPSSSNNNNKENLHLQHSNGSSSNNSCKSESRSTNSSLNDDEFEGVEMVGHWIQVQQQRPSQNHSDNIDFEENLEDQISTNSNHEQNVDADYELRSSVDSTMSSSSPSSATPTSISISDDGSEDDNNIRKYSTGHNRNVIHAQIVPTMTTAPELEKMIQSTHGGQSSFMQRPRTTPSSTSVTNRRSYSSHNPQAYQQQRSQSANRTSNTYSRYQMIDQHHYHQSNHYQTNSTIGHQRNRHHHRNKKEFKPEAWKAILALLYFFTSTWVTAIVMVIVHDRVPDMDTYPPLPDLILDNLPLIPWAFSMAETCGLILFCIWALILIFHKHRFILLRRMFNLFGSVFLIRCFTMVITSLSVPGRHLQCKARPYGTWTERLYQAYMIWQGGGMAIQGVRTCGDYMFSGHTVVLTMLNFFITEYTPPSLYLIHTMSWVLNLFGVFFILAAHEHYSIDVFIAFYISTRLFLYYHTLANNRALYQRDRHRTRIWFPLFSFFESGVTGIVPNEYEIPLRKQKDRLVNYLSMTIGRMPFIRAIFDDDWSNDDDTGGEDDHSTSPLTNNDDMIVSSQIPSTVVFSTLTTTTSSTKLKAQ